MSQKHKVGVLLCRAGQSTEEEMYNNEEATPPFSSFLSLLGEQVGLRGFTKYAAQLDTKSKCLCVCVCVCGPATCCCLNYIPLKWLYILHAFFGDH